MPKQNRQIFILNFFALLFLCACAQVVPPSGGLKDTEAPKILSTKPSNKATNVKPKIIYFNFDEYVDLKNPESAVIISPPQDTLPVFTLKKKQLQLEFKTKLRENTTYNINFGNAIQDINEFNPLENYSFVFSTGPVLDSLKITGNVYNAFSGLAAEDYTVLVYKFPHQDSAIYKQKPDYIGRTNKQGAFEINNLAAGSYSAIAVKDENASNTYDEGEMIAFSDSNIILPGQNSIQLFAFREQAARQHIRDYKIVRPGLLAIALKKPQQSFKVDVLSKDLLWSQTDILERQDTVLFWFTPPAGDSLRLRLSDYQWADTIQLNTRKWGKRDSSIKIEFANINEKGEINPEEPLTIQLPRPAIIDSKLKIIFTEGKKQSTAYKFAKSDIAQSQFKLSYPWKQDSIYQIIFPEKFFVDKNGFYNAADTIGILVYPENILGVLELKIKKASNIVGPIILQLINEKNAVIRQKTLDGEFIQFNNLSPGKYTLKAYLDSNKNLRQDPGNYLQHQQAEKAWFFNKELNIRANWLLEENWEIKR